MDSTSLDTAAPSPMARPLRERLLRFVLLNALIAIVVGVAFWGFLARADGHLLASRIAVSLIHAFFYGGMFGLLMPYLGERLSAIRFPWNWTGIIVSLVLISAVATVLIDLCLIGFGELPVERFWAESGVKTAMVSIVALLIAVCVRTYEKYRDQIQTSNLQLRTQELEKERALKLATEARLNSLESRLHPHFLFNTLNSISALITEDPALAEQTVQRLASLLRTSLDACRHNHVPLGEEIRLVADYLEIERTRFRERLAFSIDVAPELEPLAVPPMTLQPLVENCIKHSILPNPSGGEIRVSARLQHGLLLLRVWDNGPGFTEAQIPSGHGLDNLQARLKTLLGDAAALSIDPLDAGTAVEVSLPLGASETA